MTFHSKGLAWLGYKSEFIENKSTTDCKAYRFLYGFILTSMANTNFMNMYERAITVRCKCYVPITKSSYILTLNVLTISSVVLSLPLYIVSGHWVIDGRIVCSADPGWSRLTLTIVAVHDVMFVCGLMQSIGTLILIFSMARDLGKMDNTINFLQTATLSNQLQTTTADAARLLRVAQRDCWATLAYNGIAALIACLRSICRANFYYTILCDFEDNRSPVGVVEVYAFDAAEDITKLMTIVLAGLHYSIYFYHIPGARLWVIGGKDGESKELQAMREHFPENVTPDNIINAFNQCVHQAKKSSKSAHKNLSILK
ncbi:conserved hypothetical protein [Echinococcus multilocularis]|uniref:Rhodopsin orphan GPCR n=1 Tax=Echinococcus multilocularis TaxID=6211 RepID=A0A068YBQ9_ECHMU|nr:conserved hypothetical protein [Echinococcus multilocularis]